MSPVVIEIAVVLVLVIANGVFAMSEAALISARKARLQQLAAEGHANAQVAFDLASDPNRFLATVQIFITLISLLTGIFSGATLAGPLSALLQSIPGLEMYGAEIAFGLILILITFVSLLLGELVPKHLALNDPEAVAMRVARPMWWLTRLTAPLVKFLDLCTTLVMRLLGVRPTAEATVTEDELKVLLRNATKAGQFEEVERHIVEHVFRLGDMTVGMMMVPRTEIVWLDLNDSPEVNCQIIADHDFWVYPVAHGSLDNVIGVVEARDLLVRDMQHQPFDLKSSMHTPLFVPETMTGLKILEELRKSHTQIALVIDEYGGLQGLITLDDVLDEIVGDAVALPGGHPDEGIALRADGSLLVDGLVAVDNLKQRLNLKVLPHEDDGNYQTVGGFVMAYLGHIPVATDTFEYGGFRFEIVDMDGHRVEKVLVSAIQAASIFSL